ncbi:hypothetical protein GCM10010123_38460 [Pilimelia anulata]|uniref:Uncharacterized protein n=1 Tax=Pilimelia anulata TaxID=53371 RepID=A0A8J3BFC1_9ACTN|nr:hypothetical protein [Pilimelia anulata]GGK04795.1 hypothetical protein GCM10010123_38460 [Pilimelia anulata]
MRAHPALRPIQRVWHPVTIGALVAAGAAVAGGFAALSTGSNGRAAAWCSAAVVAGFATSGST